MKRTAKGSQSVCPVAPPIVVGEKETLFTLIPTPQPRRGSLGLMARLPIWLYRIGLCWLLGNRLLVLTHIGRKSGLARTFVLEVMRYTKETDTYFVAAGFGTKSIWLRNISQNSRVPVQVGHRRFDAHHRGTRGSDDPLHQGGRSLAFGNDGKRRERRRARLDERSATRAGIGGGPCRAPGESRSGHAFRAGAGRTRGGAQSCAPTHLGRHHPAGEGTDAVA